MEEQHQPVDHVCQYCTQQIVDDQPKIELLCHHRVHTECFFTRLGNLHESTTRCMVCEYFNFPPDSEIAAALGIQGEFADMEDAETVEEEVPTVPTQQSPQVQIEALYDSNPDLRADLKAFMKARREANRLQREFKTFIQSYKQGLRQKVRPLHDELKAIEQDYKTALRSSTQYKAYKRKLAGIPLMEARIETKYGWAIRQLRRALSSKPGLRQWKHERWFRYRRSVGYMVRRGFRMYLRY